MWIFDSGSSPLSPVDTSKFIDGDPQMITLLISLSIGTIDLMVDSFNFSLNWGTPSIVSPDEIRSRKSNMSRLCFLHIRYVFVMSYSPFRTYALLMARNITNLNLSGSRLRFLFSTFKTYIFSRIS